MDADKTTDRTLKLDMKINRRQGWFPKGKTGQCYLVMVVLVQAFFDEMRKVREIGLVSRFISGWMVCLKLGKR